MQREFDWADHVNEYWDEALNVNHFDRGLYGYMHDTFVAMCPEYWERPDLYTITNEGELQERYVHLELRDTSELQARLALPGAGIPRRRYQQVRYSGRKIIAGCSSISLMR